eukprot:Hpha_TRINITY_DN36071_c0_g1::TRINITY_DN36071_c0_g1_i1::g.170865::m.170865
MSGVARTCTSSEALQAKLGQWCQQLDALKEMEEEKPNKMLDFVRGFAPSDVEGGDLEAFAEQLVEDVEFFHSMVRELHQCESGECVESISGNQTTRAVFTLKPLPGQLQPGEGAGVDVVRELVFIKDEGADGEWRAEG